MKAPVDQIDSRVHPLDGVEQTCRIQRLSSVSLPFSLQLKVFLLNGGEQAVPPLRDSYPAVLSSLWCPNFH